jgi:peptide/nickel transport system permease protein
MLSDGFSTVTTDVWPLVGPLLALLVVTTCFTLLGESLRDVLDPRTTGAARTRRVRFRLPRAVRP